MKSFTVYLGGTKGDWREKFKKRFPKWSCHDPFEQSNQLCLAKFTLEDLKAVKQSDLIFFVIDYSYFTGSCIEAGYAFALGKPIVLVFLLKGRVPPMFVGISQRLFTDLETSLNWIERNFGS